VEGLKKELGYRVRGQRIKESESGSVLELREHLSSYKADFGGENGSLSQDNGYKWNKKHKYSNS
jgi:hypothetical protein